MPEPRQATKYIAKNKSMRLCLQYALTCLFRISKKLFLSIKLRTISSFDKHFLYFFKHSFKIRRIDLRTFSS